MYSTLIGAFILCFNPYKLMTVQKAHDDASFRSFFDQPGTCVALGDTLDSTCGRNFHCDAPEGNHRWISVFYVTSPAIRDGEEQDFLWLKNEQHLQRLLL